MNKPISVNECPHGVEVTWHTGFSKDDVVQIHSELLTVEEAENLAADLLNAAQDVRRVRDEESR